MSPKDSSKDEMQEQIACPQCGSDDTAPIHQEPMWVGSDQSDPKVREQPWYRCLTCRYKWKEGEEN